MGDQGRGLSNTTPVPPENVFSVFAFRRFTFYLMTLAGRVYGLLKFSYSACACPIV